MWEVQGVSILYSYSYKLTINPSHYQSTGDDNGTKKSMVPPVATVTKTPVPKTDGPSLADIQAKLKGSNDERDDEGDGETLTSLQQEEEVSISGSSARIKKIRGKGVWGLKYH